MHEMLQEMLRETLQEMLREMQQEMLDETLQETLDEMLQEMLDEMLHEMLQEMIQEILHDMLSWRLAGSCVGRGRVRLRSPPAAAGKQEQGSAPAVHGGHPFLESAWHRISATARPTFLVFVSPESGRKTCPDSGHENVTASPRAGPVSRSIRKKGSARGEAVAFSRPESGQVFAPRFRRAFPEKGRPPGARNAPQRGAENGHPPRSLRALAFSRISAAVRGSLARMRPHLTQPTRSRHRSSK